MKGRTQHMRLQAKQLLFALCLVCGIASGVRGATVTYDISINTGSLSGQKGGIYLGFFPGLNADLASLKINDFSLTAPGALAGGATMDGGASGTLDANNLALSNAFALNDYLEGLTFGNKLSFQVVFSLPNKLTGSSGSELDLELTGPDLLTPVLTSDPGGNIVVISYNQNGQFSAISTSTDATVTFAGSSASPEPSTGWLMGLPLLIGAFLRQRLFPAASK